MAEPDYRERLETAFGRPSNAAWGSAVFFETDIEDGELSSRAIQYYRNFVGDLWQRFGEAAWMSGWALVLARRGSGDIVKELEQSATGRCGPMRRCCCASLTPRPTGSPRYEQRSMILLLRWSRSTQQAMVEPTLVSWSLGGGPTGRRRFLCFSWTSIRCVALSYPRKTVPSVVVDKRSARRSDSGILT